MTHPSKIKGNRFERECVKILKEMGYKDVTRAYASNGLSLGFDEDVDIAADGIKIQCKIRKNIPKWLDMGSCDWLLYRENRGEIYKITRLKDDRTNKKDVNAPDH